MIDGANENETIVIYLVKNLNIPLDRACRVLSGAIICFAGTSSRANRDGYFSNFKLFFSYFIVVIWIFLYDKMVVSGK